MSALHSHPHTHTSFLDLRPSLTGSQAYRVVSFPSHMHLLPPSQLHVYAHCLLGMHAWASTAHHISFFTGEGQGYLQAPNLSHTQHLFPFFTQSLQHVIFNFLSTAFFLGSTKGRPTFNPPRHNDSRHHRSSRARHHVLEARSLLSSHRHLDPLRSSMMRVLVHRAWS